MSSEKNTVKRLSAREKRWEKAFLLLFPNNGDIFAQICKAQPGEVLCMLQENFSIPESLLLRMLLETPCTTWVDLHAILQEWQQCCPEKFIQLEQLRFATLPQRYALTEKELLFLIIFLSAYPNKLGLWEECFGKTPAQVASIVCAHLKGSNALDTEQAQALNIYLKSSKTWEDLSERLRKTPLNLWQYSQQACEGIDLAICLVDNLLQRGDDYSSATDKGLTAEYVSNASPGIFAKLVAFVSHSKVLRACNLPSEVVIKAIATPYLEKQHNARVGQDYFLVPPEIGFLRCRFCWRHVPRDRENKSRQAPLCFVHDLQYSASEYRKVQTKADAYEGYKRELVRKTKSLYQATRTPEEAWSLMRSFLLETNSPLPLAARYMQQYCSTSSNDLEVLQAFHGPAKDIANSTYRMALEQQLDYLLQTPMPISYPECLDLEAWLFAIQDKRKKTSQI